MATGLGYSKGDGPVKGIDRLLKRFAAISPASKEALAAGLERAANSLVSDMKAIAPASELEPHPGALKESIHSDQGRSPISKRVIADARDAKGHGYAPHVEFGHGFKDGRRAEPRPFFFVTIRRRKKALQAALRRAVSQAVKAAGPSA